MPASGPAINIGNIQCPKCKGLDSSNVNPVLIWVRKRDDAEIRNHFQKTIAVRNAGGQAKELADIYFFETLVRIHRAGEGAGYTGLKPAGKIEPPIAAADKSLETGKPQEVAQLILKRMEQGLHGHFEDMMKKKYKSDDIAAEAPSRAPTSSTRTTSSACMTPPKRWRRKTRRKRRRALLIRIGILS